MSSPVEQIKQRLGVVDVVGSYVKLIKAGANFKGRCPFHSEKTPSFFVSPPRDIWHCFGCGKGGDVFAFIMEIEGVEFIEALKILADRAGVQLKTEDPRLRNERVRLLGLMKNTTDFYRRELLNRKNILEYLLGRGLKDPTIQSYLLGYAPAESEGWRHLYEFLLNKGYSDEEIEKSGMALKSQNSNLKSQISYYDRFRGRIMFPIFDFSGRVVAFSGRIFPESTPDFDDSLKSGVKAKYINSPQTVLYDKSKILYGFDKAKTEIRKLDACVLVEGQMDVLMSHQAGVLNCVAVSGTGLSSWHLESIGRLTNNLLVSFDSDEAGLIAAGRGIDLSLEKGFEVKVVVLPFGKDPADVVLKEPEAWQKAVDESRHIIDFYLETLAGKIGEPRELKRKVEQVVLPYLSYIQSEIEKSHWISEIAKRLNMREEPVWEQLKKIKLKQITSKSDSDAGQQPGFERKSRRLLLEERLLGIVFWKNDASMIPDDKLFLFSEKHRVLLEKFKNMRGKIESGSKDYCQKLSLEGELSRVGMEDVVLEKEKEILLIELEREFIKEQCEAIMSTIKTLEEKGDEKTLGEELDKFNEFNKRLGDLRRLTESIDG